MLGDYTIRASDIGKDITFDCSRDANMIGERIDNLDESTRHRIKDISSAYARADAASREGNDVDELKYLLYAVNDISGLLLLKFDDRIDDQTAHEYAASLENSGHRIREIFEEGFE